MAYELTLQIWFDNQIDQEYNLDQDKRDWVDAKCREMHNNTALASITHDEWLIRVRALDHKNTMFMVEESNEKPLFEAINYPLPSVSILAQSTTPKR
jgi:hypothetical protein